MSSLHISREGKNVLGCSLCFLLSTVPMNSADQSQRVHTNLLLAKITVRLEVLSRDKSAQILMAQGSKVAKFF